jgi:ribosomal protein L35AE/L33A
MLKKAYVLWLFGIALLSPLAQTAAQTVQFDSATYSVDEYAGTVTITVTISEVPDDTITVDYSTSDGSATAPGDYIAINSDTLRWELLDDPAKTFTVTINDNAEIEGSEIFNLTLSNPTGGATIGDLDTTTVTIVDDDDGPGTLQFSLAEYSFNENSSSINVPVRRVGDKNGAVSVNCISSDGTATQGNDYTNTTSNPLSWAALEIGIKNCTVSITPDDEDDDNETFNLTLSKPDGTLIGDPGTTTVTIVDDDGPGILQLSDATTIVSVDESGGPATIVVQRVGGSEGDISVNYTTSNGTAIAGNDYDATSGQFIWNSGDATDRSIPVNILEDSKTEGNETFFLELSEPDGTVIGNQDTALVTILDNEGPGTLQFSTNQYSVNESSGTVSLSVMRIASFDGAVSVRCVSSDDTATAGEDYIHTTRTLKWDDGESGGKPCDVPILDDTDFENQETFNVELTNSTGGVIINDFLDAAEVTITDNDSSQTGAGILQLSEVEYSVNETGNLLTVIVTRVNGIDGAVSAKFATVDDSAEAGEDYVGISSLTLSWADGDNSNRILNINILDDVIFEGDETFDLKLSNPTGGAVIGENGEVVVTIEDNDTLPAGTLQFSAAEYEVGEGDGSVKITVTREDGSSGAVSVNLNTIDGTATAGTDYIGLSDIPLSWADGDSSPKTFNVSILDDNNSEGDEVFELELSEPTGGAVVGTRGTAEVTIVDNESGTLQFSIGAYLINESDGSLAIVVTRTGGNNGAVSVNVNTADGTAKAGTDYIGLSDMRLNWGDGNSSPKTFYINLIDDENIEGDEDFRVILSEPTGGATIGNNGEATVTITDDEASQNGTLQFSKASYSVNENGSLVTITVTRNDGNNGTAEVECNISVGGSATAGTDYIDIGTVTLNWSDGDDSDKTFNINILDDGNNEGNETFELELSNESGATLGNQSTSTVVIIDNETPSAGTLQFSKASYSVDEDGGKVRITVTREGGSFGDASVDFATVDGNADDSAVAGDDYIGDSATLSWSDGDDSDRTFRINITDDDIVEGNETFNLILSNPDNAPISDPGVAVVTIDDDDDGDAEPGTLQFSDAEYDVDEDDGSIEITVTRVGGSDGAVSVRCASSNGSATAGNDYVQTTNTLNWGDGDSAGKSCTVPILDDSIIEGDETFNLTLSNATGGATIGDPDTAVVTITDNEELPAGTLQFSAADYSVDEDGGSVEITVTREGGSDGAVSVRCASSNGSATAGNDYVQTTDTLNWGNGDNANKSCTVPILDDSIIEGDETFNMALSNSTGGATIGSPGTAVVTITDNDEEQNPGTLQFSEAEYSVGEAGSSVKITVTRKNGSDGPVSVDFATTNGTAEAGTDYISINPTLSWGDGDSSKRTFNISIIDDEDFEGDETFNLILSNPKGATIGDPGTAEVTIIDNDEPSQEPGTLQFSKAEYSVDENGGLIEITVTRKNGSDGAVTVNFATANDSAKAGKDYIGIDAKISWSDGDSSKRTLNISILDDVEVEGNETFDLELSNPTGGATLGAQDTAVVTIIDDDVEDPGTLQFSAADYSVGEGDGSVEITVTRMDGSSGAASVKVVTSNGTAKKNKDYEKTAKKLKWDDGEAGDKTFTVDILDDNKVEGDETFKLKLKKAKGAELGSQIKAEVTIIDDDSSTGEPGTLQFSKGSYSVDEDGGSVKIKVQRVDGSDGKVSVEYATSDDSATEGDDYNDKTGTLSWDDQDSDDQTFKVRIIDDNKQEGNEIFVVSLGNATGGAELGNPDTAEVEIIDDEEELPEVCDDVEQIPNHECEALVALYLDTGGNDWKSNTNWIVTNTPCSWYGVACSGGHVSRLTLYSNELKGNIPAELGDLSELQRLFLFDNGLSGEIPPELGNLAQLGYLWLHENDLCGDIPDDLMDTAIPAQEGYLKLDDNQLETDGVSNDLEDWLNDRNSGWEDSQTGNGQCN